MHLIIWIHIENELVSLITCDAPNFYFDGELYAHGEPLEKIVAMCKKDKKPTKEVKDYRKIGISHL